MLCAWLEISTMVDIEKLVFAGHLFLNVVDHAYTIEHICHKA